VSPTSKHLAAEMPHAMMTRDQLNTETLTDASKKVDLEADTEKTNYMLLSCQQNADKNHGITN
jgi:hypothetical protein